MDGPLDALIAQLIQWVGEGRPYDEVLSAWRTSCPRMPVWEEASGRGFVRVEPGGRVTVTEAGRAFAR